MSEVRIRRPELAAVLLDVTLHRDVAHGELITLVVTFDEVVVQHIAIRPTGCADQASQRFLMARATFVLLKL